MSIYEPPVPFSEPYQLLENTALPEGRKGVGDQAEGRGEIALSGEHLAPSLFEKLADDRDGLDPHERAVILAALHAFDSRKRPSFTVFQQAGGETDATTGNVVIPLYQVPAGSEGHITNVFVDAPKSATVNPSAPLANAAVWSFLAIANTGNESQAANADALRTGGIATLPVAAAGAVLPGAWTWNDSNAPVAFGGETLYYVLHGGSIAGAKALQLLVSYRINVYS